MFTISCSFCGLYEGIVLVWRRHFQRLFVNQESPFQSQLARLATCKSAILATLAASQDRTYFAHQEAISCPPLDKTLLFALFKHHARTICP